jgi:murein DD-endopeptidase MepM/ murein hydrolase activator NlpD
MRKVITILSVLVLLVVMVIIPAYANSVGSLQNQLNSISSEMERIQEELKQVKQEQRGLIEEKELMEKEINLQQKDIDVVNKLLIECEVNIVKTEEELEKAIKNVEEQYEMLKLRVRTMYEDGNSTYLSLLMNSESFSELLSKLEIIRQIIDYDTNLLDKLIQCKDTIEEAKEELENERDLQMQLKNRLVRQKREMEQNIASRDRMLDTLSTREREYSKALDEFEKTSKRLEQEIKNLQSRSGRKYTGSSMVWPTPSCHNITSSFGYRKHPVTGQNRMHTGVDIGASSGASVVAANDGVVLMSGWNGGYGNCIIIDHGGGIATLYAHNSSLLVKQGDEVTKEQVIAKVGSTGLSTGPHLHFEIRESGTPIDPMKYFR